MDFPTCLLCGGDGCIPEDRESGGGALVTCPWCGGTGIIMTEQDRQALAEDEADLTRIAREWRDFDTDPPGS
jgi:hypothetical protein